MRKLKNIKTILHPDWPDAEWNISGLFIHDRIILELARLLKERFNGALPIRAIHGSPRLRWSSGRLVNVDYDRKHTNNIIDCYRKLGIGVFLTFNNSLITKRGLGDIACNHLLNKISSTGGNNGVVVTSDILSEYLRREYPALLQQTSIVKVTMEDGKGKYEYYRQLQERFDKVTIHPDDNRNIGLLSKLSPGKIEILANEPCVRNCRNRKKHYLYISEISYNNNHVMINKLDGWMKSECAAIPYIKQIINKKTNCNLTPKEILKIYNLGIHQYKLQGRDSFLNEMLFDIVRYLFEPERSAALIFKSLLPLISNGGSAAL